MLTYRYINGLDVERTGLQMTNKFAPEVTTVGVSGSFEQGSRVTGLSGYGQAWRLFNTAGREKNYHALLGENCQNVVGHMLFKQLGTFSALFNGPMVFWRFQYGNAMQISFRLKTSGGVSSYVIECFRGGNGDNACTGGTLIGTSSTTWTLEEIKRLECRIEIHSSAGTVRLWQDGVLVMHLFGISTKPVATGYCDKVTWRGQGGQVFVEWDDLIIASDDTTGSERIGAVRVDPLRLTEDYQNGLGWTPNGGLTHVSRFADNDVFNQTPDGDITYLSGGASSGDDLYTCIEPACTAAVRAISLNVAAKALTGAPTIQPRLLYSDGELYNFGAVQTPESTRYAVQQSIMTFNPEDNRWTDGQIGESAFGIRGGGSGTMRVSLVYLERVLSLTGEPYECDGSGAGNFFD